MIKRKLVLTKYKEQDAAFLFEDDQLIQIFFSAPANSRIGDIYVGRVKNVVPAISAAFVEYSKGITGFLPIGEVKSKHVLNREYDGNLRGGDELMVQICKEPLKTKDATLTTDISFSGTYLVLVPFSKGIHYSKKFSAQEKKELREVISDVIRQLLGEIDVFLQNYGLIVRTNAANAPVMEVGQELHELFHKASSVLSVADKRTVFSCLYQEDSFFKKVIKNHFKIGTTEVVTDRNDVYENLIEEYGAFPDFVESLRLYMDAGISLLNLYGIQEKIDRAISKKVWLRSGGYLIIEPTEALTVVDVNSGKSTPTRNKLSPEEFYYKTNQEAAAELMRQLRLRNISGIIIVDFLKTKEENTEKIIQYLKEAVKSDPVETLVFGKTALGLVEITRKKTEASLQEKLQHLIIDNRE